MRRGPAALQVGGWRADGLGRSPIFVIVSVRSFVDKDPGEEGVHDWLRSHRDDRLRYEEAKRELAARTWKYTQNYADAKTKVVQEILARAHRQP